MASGRRVAAGARASRIIVVAMTIVAREPPLICKIRVQAAAVRGRRVLPLFISILKHFGLRTQISAFGEALQSK
jgi:hypothetical protein